MATPTKPELIESLTKVGVTLTGDETVADLKELMAVHVGTFSDSNGQESARDLPKSDHTRSVFHLHNIVHKTREFNEETHGENWKEIADEFEKNNVKKIRSREDL